MATRELNLRPLAVPGVVAGVALALLAATIHLAGAWVGERERAFRQARGELARAASQYRNASDDQAVYEQYAARFRRMSERGWIGTEQRLTWIEALQRVNRDLELPTLRYEIGRRQTVPLDGADFETSHLQLYRTPMELRLGALHEGDLLQLLDGLAERGGGLTALERCRIARAQAPGQVRLSAGATNLEVDCTLHWYTLEIRRPEDTAS